LKYPEPPLWPSYIGERRTTFAKAYGIKVRCSREHVGEHNGNMGEHGGTHWEFGPELASSWFLQQLSSLLGLEFFFKKNGR